MSRAGHRRALLAATLVGLALRVGWARLAPSPPREDAAEYHALGARLADGRGYVGPDGAPTAFRPPGLPLLLGAVYAIRGPDPAAARLVLALLGALAVPLVGRLGGALAGDRAGLIAAFAAAVYPPFVSSWYGPRALLAEVPLTTAMLVALALAVRAREAGGRGGDAAGSARDALLAALLAGLAAGVAVLTRGTLVFLPPLLALWLVSGGGTRARRCAVALAVLAGALAVVAPWTLRNRRVFAAWVPVSTNGGISVWASYNPRSRGLGNAEEGYGEAVREDARLAAAGVDEVARSRWFAGRARAEVRARPGRALRLVARKLLLFADPSQKDWSRDDPPLAYNLAYGAVLPLAAIGLGLGLRAERGRSVAWLLAGVGVLITAVHVLLHTDVRYRVTVEPLLLAFAAGAVSAGVGRWGWRRVSLGAAAYLAGHVALGLVYADVFALLSSVTRAIGLGLR